MDKKIDNNFNQKVSVIIDRPDALSPLRQGTEWGITTLGWIIWFFSLPTADFSFPLVCRDGDLL